MEFTPDGDRTGEFDTPWVGDWAADLAWDAGRGLLWHVNVGGDNAIYGVDPTDGSVVETVTGPGWTDISQRGLAYDQATDTFYIGGWNEGIVYHVAGPVVARARRDARLVQPRRSQHLRARVEPRLPQALGGHELRVRRHLADRPRHLRDGGRVPHPDPGFNGAGLELDAVGNLWTVSQGSQTAYLIESGLPTFSDVPWLDVTPDRRCRGGR